MPNVNEYLTGFGLTKGATLNGYQLIQLDAAHHQVKLYNEYSYPTDLLWEWTDPQRNPTLDDLQRFFIDFTQYVSPTRVIYSESGRPYKCRFQWPSDSPPTEEHTPDFRRVLLHYQGFAKRIGKAEAEAISQGRETW